MENSRKIKNVVLIVVLALLALFVILYFFTPIFRSGLSRKDIQAILDKRNSLTSIHARVYDLPENSVTSSSPTAYIEFFMHDNFAQVSYVLQDGQKIIYQEDKTTGNVTFISEPAKNILLNFNHLKAFSFWPLKNYDNIFEYDKFEYLGSTKINERETSIISLQMDNTSEKEIVYIDNETGFIVETASDDGTLHTAEFAHIEPLNNSDFVIDIEKTYPDYKITDMSQQNIEE